MRDERAKAGVVENALADDVDARLDQDAAPPGTRDTALRARAPDIGLIGSVIAVSVRVIGHRGPSRRAGALSLPN